MRVPRREMRLVWIVSGIILVVALISIFAVIFVLRAPLPVRWDDLAIILAMTAIFPPAAVNFMDTRWRNSIDNNIPRLLREIAEAGRSGLTLTRAIEVSAERKYGALTKELRRLVSQLSWGVPLEEALRSFAERADTRLARRTATLISEVARAGGDIQEVLEAINRHIGELQLIERERRASIRPYVAIIYVAFAVFIVTDILLIRTFFAELARLQAEGAGFLALGAVDVGTIKRVFFHMGIVQAFFGGLIAGKMGEASMGAGLKHTLIMMAASFVAFLILVP